MRRRLHRFTNADTICVGKADKLILEKVGELFSGLKCRLSAVFKDIPRVLNLGCLFFTVVVLAFELE